MGNFVSTRRGVLVIPLTSRQSDCRRELIQLHCNACVGVIANYARLKALDGSIHDRSSRTVNMYFMFIQRSHIKLLDCVCLLPLTREWHVQTRPTKGKWSSKRNVAQAARWFDSLLHATFWEYFREDDSTEASTRIIYRHQHNLILDRASACLLATQRYEARTDKTPGFAIVA